MEHTVPWLNCYTKWSEAISNKPCFYQLTSWSTLQQWSSRGWIWISVLHLLLRFQELLYPEWWWIQCISPGTLGRWKDMLDVCCRAPWEMCLTQCSWYVRGNLRIWKKFILTKRWCAQNSSSGPNLGAWCKHDPIHQHALLRFITLCVILYNCHS